MTILPVRRRFGPVCPPSSVDPSPKAIGKRSLKAALFPHGVPAMLLALVPILRRAAAKTNANPAVAIGSAADKVSA
jgi:hypothetical protein